MAKDLFSIAAQAYKESPREIKRRKTIIIVCWIFAVVAFAYGAYFLSKLPLNIGFHELAKIREHQIALTETAIVLLMGLLALAFSWLLTQFSIWSFGIFLFLSLLAGGIIVYSDLSGFEIVRGRGVGAAYGLCFVLPILAIVLIIDQRRKRR